MIHEFLIGPKVAAGSTYVYVLADLFLEFHQPGTKFLRLTMGFHLWAVGLSGFSAPSETHTNG